MKLSATTKNERGGKKTSCDDIRLLVELSHGNKIVGEVGLYAITGTDLKGNEVSGYRILFDGKVIKEEERQS